VVGETQYGGRYASVVSERNICGVQFHPEKSQHVGLRMLKNFVTGFQVRDLQDEGIPVNSEKS
jgi:imidazoleglycerol phosphate synthase glutamine amidotransferase subunit HisH